jgi:hypothetical protein
MFHSLGGKRTLPGITDETRNNKRETAALTDQCLKRPRLRAAGALRLRARRVEEAITKDIDG